MLRINKVNYHCIRHSPHFYQDDSPHLNADITKDFIFIGEVHFFCKFILWLVALQLTNNVAGNENHSEYASIC